MLCHILWYIFIQNYYISFIAVDKTGWIGIIGAGPQAVWQLRFLASIVATGNVLLRTRSRETAEKFVAKMRDSTCELDRRWNIVIADSSSDFKRCQLIHTLTNSRKPVLSMADLDASNGGLHITAVGADSPG